MKELIEKIGIDKIAHFGVGGLLCALMTFVVMLQEGGEIGWWCLAMPTIGSVVVFIVSWVKEKVIDEVFTWKDIWAAMLGCLTVYIAVLTGVLFRLLSN